MRKKTSKKFGFYLNENCVDTTPTMTCSICGKTFRGYGNDAFPYKGKCCDECNTYVVLPARFKQLTGMDVMFV